MESSFVVPRRYFFAANEDKKVTRQSHDDTTTDIATKAQSFVIILFFSLDMNWLRQKPIFSFLYVVI